MHLRKQSSLLRLRRGRGPGASPAPSHEISWPAVPGARFYVVSIVDAGGEVATFHRATNHVTLRVGTVLRDGIVIRAGAYDWSVAPAFGARAAPRARQFARSRARRPGRVS